MQPTTLAVPAADTVPNFELLRRHGWSVNTMCGSYCVAFRGSEEVVLRWHNGVWQRVSGRGASSEI